MEPTAFEKQSAPRVLIATPGVTFLPAGAGDLNGVLPGDSAHAADLDAAFVAELRRAGVDVHVTLPHYRRMFQPELAAFVARELQALRDVLPAARIHPAQDRLFYYREEDAAPGLTAVRLALVFQREVMQRIVPLVKPGLLHCTDWMTGLLPPAAQALGLPAVFTAHHLHTRPIGLAELEAAGWDPQPFWRRLYYESLPGEYLETRAANRIDALTSGIFAASFAAVPSPAFLAEVAAGRLAYVPDAARRELARQQAAGAAAGILAPPDASFDPAADPALAARFTPADAAAAKALNKLEFQRAMGLAENAQAALFFWPSRLDADQKGSPLLMQVLADTVAAARGVPAQIAVVADGVHQKPLRDEILYHGLEAAVALRDFDPALSRLGYAAADFALIPSLYEPAGRAAMTALRYGCLPVARRTGALHDLVRPLDADRSAGNGFVFEDYDAGGLRWAIGQALSFFRLPADVRAATLTRVMQEARDALSPQACARRYAALYAAVAAARPSPG